MQSQVQKTIEITDGNRGVRFVVYFEDDTENMYDIEMQTYREEALQEGRAVGRAEGRSETVKRIKPYTGFA